MRYIFLDVDGVLNNANTKAINPSGYAGVSSKLVRNLAKIVFATGAGIILSSDWKGGWSRARYDCDEEQMKHLVHTDSDKGLTEEDVCKAIDILSIELSGG